MSLHCLQQVDDPAVMVSFPIKGDPDGAAFIAWTTTPWTLPSNLALCVNAELTYVKVSGINADTATPNLRMIVVRIYTCAGMPMHMCRHANAYVQTCMPMQNLPMQARQCRINL